MTTLSLCMICRDNADTIRPCLQSIRPWVDELVVVDTGSADATPRIVQEFGAKLYHFPWCDDFAAARNESLRHARGAWLFWMDSDDTIDEDNGRKLRALAYQRHASATLGYVMQVYCPGERERDVTVVDHVKLFRNHPQIRFEFRIHEQVLMSIRRLGGDVQWTDIYVIHSGADNSPQGQQRKCNRDLRLLELELEDRPNHPFVLFNLGMTYSHQQKHAAAITYLRRCLTISGPEESHVRKAYALLAASLAEIGDKESALAACTEGLNLLPKDPELHFRRGVICQSLGQLRDAEAAYLAALNGSGERGNHFTSLDPGIMSYKARHNLALVYAELGDLGLAEVQWRHAIAFGFQPSQHALREILLEQCRTCAAQLLNVSS